MVVNSPIVFEPLYMERVWGGRRLESVFARTLPPGAVIGESWEIVDRADWQSIVADGPLKGATLHELWTRQKEEIFGSNLPETARFPLLLKLLDCEEHLSLQVHPPASVAAALGGEPKTEMWYVLQAREGSSVLAGFNKATTREEFEAALADGSVAGVIHQIPTTAGTAVYVPSGRVHAIGGGNVIFEVQQNSDTTYRVFDWNRLGLDGLPRQLHIKESLASIDFGDIAPPPAGDDRNHLVACQHFRVERWSIAGSRSPNLNGRFAIFTVAEGEIECGACSFVAGSSFLLACSLEIPLRGEGTILKTTIPGLGE